MKLVVVGGSGKVGRIVVPTLARDHDVTVMDRSAPAYPGTQFLSADLTDPATWHELPAADALLFMAMAPPAPAGDMVAAAAQVDVSVRGLYLALNWAGRTGASRAIYASSLTVFSTPTGERYPDNAALPDAWRAYGLTKRLGEEVCRAAVEEWGMSITALRLAHPSTDEEWQGEVYPTATSPRDLTRAFQAALWREGGGFVAAPVSGDVTGRYVDIAPSRLLLGWEPQERLTLEKPWPVKR